MKGIILAGGTGSRLHPASLVISKHLMPIYDKPMIYYPLSTLMFAGINEILIITSPDQLSLFQKLLGDGSKYGIKLSWASQVKPEGIAQAFLLSRDFINNSPVCLILGDNLFFGTNLPARLQQATRLTRGAKIFAYQVSDPREYGVVNFDEHFNATSIEEKPARPTSNWAITGLYFYDSSAVKKAELLSPSPRGELEITDLNRLYLQENLLSVETLGRGAAWLDTGRPDDLHEASSFVKTLQNRTGLTIGSPEEAALNQGWKVKPVSGVSQYYKRLERLFTKDPKLQGEAG